jgi:UDP-N-acetylglucosamine 1-carboxyvinyltransferase
MNTSVSLRGKKQLIGTIKSSGAKNAILPILSAVIMLDGETTLFNIPPIGDVNLMIRMLNALNIRAEYGFNNNIQILNNKKIKHIAPYDLVTSMRASFFVAGPLLAKTGYAKVPLPGGCSIGQRPVDIHIKGLEKLGAQVRIEHGFVEFKAAKLKGAKVELSFPSVGATENILNAAALAEGETIITNAAREPEIEDLANFLRQAGAQIEGDGTSRITVNGVQSLTGIDKYHVMPDRIEVGTLLLAGAITKGDVTVTNAKQAHLECFLEKLDKAGLNITCDENTIRCQYNGEIKAIDFETEPHPGFPTDLQAQLMALLCVADGKSVIKEKIFENRFMHVNELKRMGASISTDGRIAVVNGAKLSGAEVKITDLRAGAALILAGLVADGTTIVYGLKHLNRGYYNLLGKLQEIGADISL